MIDITKRAFGVNLKLMRFLCLYNSKKSTYLYKFKAYFMYIIFVWPLPCLGILNLFMKERLDIDRVNYDAAVLAEGACFIMKYLPFIKNVEQIKKCIDYFKSSSFTETLNSKQRQIMEESIEICRQNTFIYLSVITGGVISWSIRPLFWKEHLLPIDMWLPFDITSKIYIFYLIYLFLVISMFYMGTVTSTIDPLIGGLACLVTAQLKILQDKLQHLDAHADIVLKQKKNLNFNKDKIIYQQIQNCIDHHNDIIRFAQQFEKCFSLSIFSQIVAGVFVICFSCLQITKLQATDIASIYQMGTYALGVIGQIYFYCNYGSTVFEESDNITNAIYMGKWYDYNLKSKKALGILMARTQKPINITSGKIFELSLGTFAVILKRSYSLIAVLKNYYQ